MPQSILFNFFSYCSSEKVWKFGKISTALKVFRIYWILVAKFLSFIVKFFSLDTSFYQQMQFLTKMIQRQKKMPIFPDYLMWEVFWDCFNMFFDIFLLMSFFIPHMKMRVFHWLLVDNVWSLCVKSNFVNTWIPDWKPLCIITCNLHARILI